MTVSVRVQRVHRPAVLAAIGAGCRVLGVRLGVSVRVPVRVRVRVKVKVSLRVHGATTG